MTEGQTLTSHHTILDICKEAGEVLKGFSKERITTKMVLCKIASIAKRIEHEGEYYYTITEDNIISVGTNLKTFNRINNKYNLFEWTGNKPNKFKGIAKRYLVTENLHKILDLYNESDNPKRFVYYKVSGESEGHLVDEEDDPLTPLKNPPDYCSVAVVDKKDVLENMLGNNQKDFDTKRKLMMVKQSDGFLKQNYYRSSKGGRLFAHGITSLQNFPKSLRKALFKGAYDIDMKSCHFAIGVAYSPNNEPLERYVKNTDTIRRTVAEDIGVDVSVVKHAFLSNLFGSGRSLRKGTALVNLFDGDKKKAGEFLAHPLVKEILKGVDNLKKDLDNAGHIDTSFGRDSEQMAVFLQSKEAEILDICVANMEGDPDLLLFDGLITHSDEDVEHLSKCILDKTGIEITLTKEEL